MTRTIELLGSAHQNPWPQDGVTPFTLIYETGKYTGLFVVMEPTRNVGGWSREVFTRMFCD